MESFPRQRGYSDGMCDPSRLTVIGLRANTALQLNLVIADVLMSFGAISDVYWAHHRQVFCGSHCNAQGVLQTMGETAAALSTLSVAIYSWMAVHQNPPPTYSPWRCLAVIAVIWLWVLLWAVIPLGMKKYTGSDAAGNVRDFYTPTPWCKSSLLGVLCDTSQ
jgi:hypothetical protein